MITPQQIDQISFSKATFGGYNMEQVDEILEPLTEDYVTLYKENALLKSKMRVLVGKLEEYRKNEAAVKEAAMNAKRATEKMMQEAEAKCAKMMQEAKEAAAKASAEVAPVAAPAPVVAKVDTSASDALVAAANARVAEAQQTANNRINEIQSQMRSCIQALERIKTADAPAAPAAPVAAVPVVEPAAPVEVYDNDAVAGEISQTLEALVGTTQDTAPKAPPKHPTHDATTSRFTNLNLQFGRNYDPTH